MWRRRDAMLRLGAAAGGALALPALLATERADARAGESPPSSSPGSGAARLASGGNARSCIFLFMWGGQPQQDMWDLKPDAPSEIRSPFAPIETSAPGILLGEPMPQIARHADKLAIVRSLQHAATDHGVSVYHALTGRAMLPPRTFPGNSRTRNDPPTVGSMVSYLGGKSALPASIALPRGIAHDGVKYAGTYAGYLGPRHDPVELGHGYNHVEVGFRGDRGDSMPLMPPDDVSTARLLARRGLLATLEAQDQRYQRNPAAAAYEGVTDEAWRLVGSPAVKEALNLENEPAAVRDRYGRNEYGESFLTARRLVEAGIRLVSVNWMFITPAHKLYNVWDVHGGLGDLEHGATGYGMLKAHYCLPSFDKAFSALLEDLSQRGLLDETLVACAGEFGRTPKINANNGRDHWPYCYSAVFAGGGVRGGTVFGASDRQAAYVKENPVTPGDYLATLCQAMGLDPHREARDLEGRPSRVCDGEPISAVLG